jgi:predicted deacylase
LRIKAELERMEPGTRGKGRISVGTMASGAEIALPYVLLKGARPGPCLWIVGHVHGTEINGILAALDFVNGLDLGALSGSVVLVSSGNPLALDARRKTAPQDEQDLDQSFPGRADGFTTERLAFALFEEAKDCADTLVNMHTMTAPFEAKVYAVYKVHPNGRVPEEQLLRRISPFRPSVACRMSVQPSQGELPGNIAGGFDYQMAERGVPAFMIELGAGGRATPADIHQGIEGFRGVARALGMVEGANEPRTLRRVARRGHITLSQGGLFRAACAPGEVVKAGTIAAEVMNLWGEVVERVAMPSDVIIIGVRREPVAHTGDRFGFVAYDWDEVTA